MGEWLLMSKSRKQYVNVAKLVAERYKLGQKTPRT
jgi:hypothetical protein